jgi:hypothetical protein
MHALTNGARRLHALLQQHGPLVRGGAAGIVAYASQRPKSKPRPSSAAAGANAAADATANSTPSLPDRLRSAALRLSLSLAVGTLVAAATRGSAADVARRAALRRVAQHAGLGELLGAPLVATSTTAAVATGGGLRSRALDLGGGVSLPFPWPAAQRVRIALEVTGSGGAAGGRGGAAAGALVAADAFLSPSGRARFRLLYVDVPCESASADARVGGVEELFLEAQGRAAATGGAGPGLAALLEREEEEEEGKAPAAHVDPPFARITLVGTPLPTSARSPVRDALRLALYRARQERERERDRATAAAAQDEAEKLPELEVVRAAREAAGRALTLGAGLVSRARAAVVGEGETAAGGAASDAAQEGRRDAGGGGKS